MTTQTIRAEVNLPGLLAGRHAEADTSDAAVKQYLDAGMATVIAKKHAQTDVQAEPFVGETPAAGAGETGQRTT